MPRSKARLEIAVATFLTKLAEFDKAKADGSGSRLQKARWVSKVAGKPYTFTIERGDYLNP